MDETEIARVTALGVDARYAYAINAIRESGELWTLVEDDDWVVSSASGRSTIPIWPHERFAALAATGPWARATPARISLEHDWVSDRRASWFEDNEVLVSVFLAGASSMTVDHATFVELLRGETRARYLRGRRASGVAREPKRSTRETRDLVPYINMRDINVVIERVPAEYRTRVRDILLRRSSDAKVLGCVSTRGRRDIVLATKLPIRVSLGRYLHGGQSPDEFGAPRLGQWPPWAVRRFFLYDVLLHEIGHLQIVDAKASRVERKFASETRAQELADELRRTLYSEHFEHPNPIHNAPTEGERETLAVWSRLNKTQRQFLV